MISSTASGESTAFIGAKMRETRGSVRARAVEIAQEFEAADRISCICARFRAPPYRKRRRADNGSNGGAGHNLRP